MTAPANPLAPFAYSLAGLSNPAVRAAVGAPRSWLEYRHPAYEAGVARWTFARDLYTGEVLNPEKVAIYLVQKTLGEAPEAYAERVRLADFTPHFGAVVDSLVGMLFQSESDATREEGALGLPDDLDSVLGKYATNADGEGNGYLALWKLLAIDLTALHDTWVLVDGTNAVRLIPPEAVVNWRESGGVVVEALVVEQSDDRASLMDKPEPVTQYVRFTVDGWQRYRQADGGAVAPVGEGGAYKFEDARGRRALPLYRVRLPLRRAVGYLLARKANVIFNNESVRDYQLRFACTPFLNIVGNDSTYAKVVESIKKGSRVLQNLPGQQGGTHDFIAPSGDPARVLGEVLTRKVEEFWRAAFREYADAAVEKTAAEVRQDVAAGVGAFLTMLKAAVDTAENEALWRLEQAHFPNDRSKWFEARVERSDDFVPFDINQTIERLRTRYFGAAATIPVGRSAQVSAATQAATWDGLEADPKEITAAVDARAITEAMESLAGLPVPADAKAELAVKYLLALGYASAGATVEMGDGSQRPLVDVLRERARELAQVQEDSTTRGGAFGAPPLI